MGGFIAIVVIMILLVVVGGLYGAHVARKRRELLAGWCARRDLAFLPAADPTFDNRYPHLRCLKQGTKGRQAYNICQGQWNGRALFAFDYRYQTTQRTKNGTRTVNHYLSAVMLFSDVWLKEVYIRPEGFFDRIGAFFGFDDIDFESAEFSKRFHVKAADRRFAYDILHARMIEFLLQQPKHHIELDREHVVVWTGRIFNLHEFEQAIAIAEKLLDGMPEYLRQQQKALL